jgi:hypothetical protein
MFSQQKDRNISTNNITVYCPLSTVHYLSENDTKNHPPQSLFVSGFGGECLLAYHHCDWGQWYIYHSGR